MGETANKKKYLFASDFDKTLSFNDSGYVLSELLEIPLEEFERKATGMAHLNLVQQGGELTYLLLHDPEFRSRVRQHHLYEVGRRIRLKQDIDLLYQFLSQGIDNYYFDFYVLSAAPTEVIQSALENIIPPDHIYGTDFSYHSSGEIDTITQVTGLKIPPNRIIYVGDGSSDIHVMLHVNQRDGFTIAVSETKYIAQIAKRTVLSESALGVLVPILEEIVGWERPRIRALFEAKGFLIQEWDKIQTDWLTIRRSSSAAEPEMATRSAAGRP
jgi:2-hydroxy-3-keto-5-methylthiopentenyl-1-phosphate phosphatase